MEASQLDQIRKSCLPSPLSMLSA